MNLLVIMADQLMARALSGWGGQAITPNIDRLIDKGVVFEQAYSNSPLCAPARFSMMSGRFASNINAYDNASEFCSDIPTFAHTLRSSGFETTLAGKMHFIGADQLHGFEHRTTTDIYPADFGWTPDWEHPTRRFQKWYHNLSSVKHSGVAAITNQLEYDDEVGNSAVKKLLDLGRHQEQPFCLLVSFTHPHDPYVCRQQHWNLYRHIEIAPPHVSPMARDQLDIHSQRLYDLVQTDEFSITQQDVERARRCYLGNVSYFDDWVGRLISTLHVVDRAKNTAVILLSDHGDMLGERGLWYKMSLLEPSLQIPLIIHAPQYFTSTRVKTPVSLVDIFPTLLGLAKLHNNEHISIDLPRILDGDSLLPLLTNDNSKVLEERALIAEYLGEGVAAPCVMIRRNEWKYIYCETDPPQLYNLATDPDELHNLAQDTAHRQLANSMNEEVHKRWQVSELREKIIANQHDRKIVYDALRKGKYAPWDFQFFEDASARFMRNHLDLNDLEAVARYPKV